MKNVLTGSVALLAAAAVVAGGQLETIDARLLAGEVVSISAERVLLKTKQGKQAVPLGEVVEISLAKASDAMATVGRSVVTTSFGDLLAVSDVTSDGTRLQATGPLLGSVKLPMEAVRTLYLPGATQSPRDIENRLEEMDLADASGDRIIVSRKGKQALAIDGVLEALGRKKVRFRWKDSSRTVDRATVPLVRLAVVGTKTSAHSGTLLGREGSQLHFTALTLEGTSIRLDSPAVGKQTVPVSRVAGIRFASSNVVRLADLKPSAVKEHGFFDTTFHYRANRSVSGRRLRLAGRTYRTGLGLHSFCELTYPLDEQYTQLVAMAGIDDGVRPHGDATLTFLGDGKPLGKPLRLTGKGAPEAIRLKLDGVKTLVIRADFGPDGLGFSDHVDLAGARLIK